VGLFLGKKLIQLIDNQLFMKNEIKQKPLIENIHYYWEKGLMVFTERYHRERGYCCKSGCRHCPYGFKK
jgi:hypothetical protein